MKIQHYNNLVKVFWERHEETLMTCEKSTDTCEGEIQKKLLNEWYNSQKHVPDRYKKLTTVQMKPCHSAQYECTSIEK